MNPKKTPPIDLQQLSELLADAQLAFEFLATLNESIGGEHLAELISKHKINSKQAGQFIVEIEGLKKQGGSL